MAPSSQGSVAIRQNESKDIFRAGASVASIDPRPAKRPRLSPTKDKENASILRHGSTSVRSPAKRSKPSFTADDEANMMENLMAGLDASIFDNFTSSPVTKVPSQSRVNARTPGKGRSDRTIPSVKREILSPTKNTYHTRPIAMRLQPPFKQSPDLKPVVSSPKGKRKASPAMDRVTIKHEMTTMARVKDEAFDVKEDKDKPELDDELFEFEFDLADLSAADLDLLDGTSAPVVKYPILNPPVPSPPADYRTTPWMRCCVVVALAGLQLTDGVVPPEEELLKFDMLPAPRHGMGKTVVVKQEGNDFRRVIHLKERWEDLPLRTGDIINIISPSLEDEGSKQPILISFKDPKSFIIHHPDIMLTMTSIANAMPCPRKPILQSLIRMPGPASKPMLYGNILHGLLQGALQEQNFGIDETRRRLNDELRKESIKLDVWGTGLGLDDVRQEVGGKAGLGFEKFGQKWIGSTPKNEGDLHAQSGEKPSLLAITGLHDVEEDIWSPKWGLKGKVDASVQASILAPGAKQADENIAPLEIKTGRSVGVMAHRAQTMLYTLLMEDRYGIPVPAGLLYYSQLDSVLRVEAKSNEIRALIITRNELASYLANERTLLDSTSSDAPSTEKAAFLPPTTDHAKECKSCYAVDSCMLYRRAIDNVPTHDDDDEIFELYAEKAGELTDADAAFFKKWENLLTIEEQDVLRFKSQLWTMTAEQREKAGRCFSNMVISAYSNDLGKSLAKIHRHSYTFTRAQLDASQSAKSLLSGHIARGDPVNLSIEPDILCLSRGFVTDLKPDSITIGVAYVIDPAALLERTKHRNHAMSGDKVVFRIDKDEMAAGTMKMRANLAALFFSDVSDSVKRLRQLVVQHQAPEYEIARLPRSEKIPDSFNADQTKAMEKIMTAKDYSLILGMPGTGKTTTIAEIIKALVARGKTVLLSSYTHSAVDTILMKLLNSEFEMLRLGNIDKVHPDVQHLTLEAHEESSDLLQLDARLMRPPVVAATCLSVDHPLFFKRRFDYCIVDEASQITLPTCLGPLRLADTFVLVGDHFQLPPIVKNREAKQGGLDVSLFRLLSEAHPEAVVDLSHQYRMNEDIMLLSNRLIYENRLKCGNEFVAKQSLVLPRRKKCQEISGKTCSQPCWVQDLMAENVKAVFVDTDLVPAYDSRIGNLVQNEIEAGFIAQLSKALIASGLNPSDLAVITPYRQQIKLLTGLFADMPSVEILTADKSQGRDKECILISLVRSNASGYIGELLKDWRRINVSFTRAKRKLVIFGSRRTMAGDPLLKDFLQLMEEQKWIYTLPKGAKGHEGGPSIEPEESKAEGSVKAEENGKENVTVKEEKGKGKAKLGESLIERKPFLRDILADIG